MFAIAEIDPISAMFPTRVDHLMPKYENIPKEFKNWNGRGKWNKVVSDWFFYGLKNAKWTPKPGVDTQKALRHVKVVLGSWEPKHEHKEAGVAFLLNEWFVDVKYELKNDLNSGTEQSGKSG